MRWPVFAPLFLAPTAVDFVFWLHISVCIYYFSWFILHFIIQIVNHINSKLKPFKILWNIVIVILMFSFFALYSNPKVFSFPLCCFAFSTAYIHSLRLPVACILPVTFIDLNNFVYYPTLNWISNHFIDSFIHFIAHAFSIHVLVHVYNVHVCIISMECQSIWI